MNELSAREADVLGRVAQGHHNKEIARALGISLSTTKNYVTSILRKLGVENRTEAALLLRAAETAPALAAVRTATFRAAMNAVCPGCAANRPLTFNLDRTQMVHIVPDSYATTPHRTTTAPCFANAIRELAITQEAANVE